MSNNPLPPHQGNIPGYPSSYSGMYIPNTSFQPNTSPRLPPPPITGKSHEGKKEETSSQTTHTFPPPPIMNQQHPNYHQYNYPYYHQPYYGYDQYQGHQNIGGVQNTQNQLYPELIESGDNVPISADEQATESNETDKSEEYRSCEESIENLAERLVDDNKKGIRVLCLDGGGIRGLLALELVRKLEKKTKKRMHELFDMICGTSTGGMLAVALGLAKMNAKECRALYLEMKDKVFGKKNKLPIPSFYEAEALEKLFKELSDGRGMQPMSDFCPQKGYPAVFVLSTVTNTVRPETFLFRNYEYKPGVQTNYPGSSVFKVWEACRATTAAPVYFTPIHTLHPVSLQTLIHIDGGVGENNPAAIAVAECKKLWGSLENVKCIVSIGTGKPKKNALNVGHINSMAMRQDQKSFSLAGIAKSYSYDFQRLIETVKVLIACSTTCEVTHKFLDTLLQDGEVKYYRLNPELEKMYDLAEIDPKKLHEMKVETKKYIKSNKYFIREIKDVLLGKEGKKKKNNNNNNIPPLSSTGTG